MKYARLILANLGRKKVRTILTVGSFFVALFLFGVLATLNFTFGMGTEIASAERLAVINRVSLIQPLPVAYKEQIAALPGVTLVTHANWFGGVYQNTDNFFPQFAVEPESWLAMYKEFRVPPGQWKAFLEDRQGAVVGEATARRFGWKIGDRIPIMGTIFPGQWEFNLRAIYTGTRPGDDETQFWFQYKTLEERAPAYNKGLIGWYVVRVGDPDQAVEVARAIDARFANSSWETRAFTESAFAANFAKQMGNIKFLLLLIGSVVFATLLLVTGSTMAIAVRERTAEIGILKAIGYSDGAVLGLVIAESLVYALVGGGLGLLAAKAITLGGDPTGFLGIIYLSGENMAWGCVLLLVVGAAAAAIPAWNAMRLRVVDALRRA
ncbi:MAG TPA: FtsX-like permease family protein [Candidatus Polarisedimenticolaceae bacterium]|nr:FtsX-like permease family protein [Candidatus Polarisedimenticolaceae bacterium]